MAENQHINPESFNIDEFSKKSEAFYLEIKISLESQYKGKYAAIDYESKKYWIGETASDALSKAKNDFPSKLFYLVQVGSPSTFTVQSMIRKNGLLGKHNDPQWAY